MKVLHYQHNGAGVVLSDGLKEIGVKSVVASTAKHPFGFKEDVLIKGPKDLLELGDFDILHTHDEACKLPRKVKKQYKGRIVQHYHNAMPEETKVLKNGDIDFVSTPNLLIKFPDAIWIPLPVDTRKFVPMNNREYVGIGFNGRTLDKRKKKYLVTPLIDDIIKAMRSMGQDAIMMPQPLGIPHHEMHEKYWSKIDLWIDRFGLGFYGFNTVEAASCAIIVVCDLDPVWSGWVDCPFIVSNRKDLVKDILNIRVTDQELKRRHRSYAYHLHDNRKVAGLCVEQYERLLDE